MSKKNNVISAIKSSWKDLQKSLTEFSYDKLAQQDSSFSNQVLNTLYEISLKEISVINNISSENMSNKKPLKIKSNKENRLSFREILFSSDGMKDCIGGGILYDTKDPMSVASLMENILTNTSLQ